MQRLFTVPRYQYRQYINNNNNNNIAMINLLRDGHGPTFTQRKGVMDPHTSTRTLPASTARCLTRASQKLYLTGEQN